MNPANALCFLLFVTFALEAYSYERLFTPPPPSSNHFQCKKGKLGYIYDRWFCDGNTDCDDGSDEGYGCDREACGRGKFKCPQGSCINITKHCDTTKDCTDGADEKNCGEEIDIKSCLSREDKFVCDNKKQCIGLQYVCDNFCNCQDCSDESASGCSKYDDYLCKKCSGSCYSKKPNNTLASPPQKSQSISLGDCKLCSKSGVCHQKCLSIENLRERCICDEHYYPDENPTTPSEYDHYWSFQLPDQRCINSVPYENVIVYSTPKEVKLFNLTTNETTSLQSGVDCTAITAAHDDVFCATFSNNTAVILKISIKTKHSTKLIQGDSLVLSIAIDWITNNIYYTTNFSLMVCASDGKTCTKLKLCLRCIVRVAPKRGLMFLLAKDDKYIMQAALDGSNQKRFRQIPETNPTPVSPHVALFFTIDESADGMFWSEFSGTRITMFRRSRFDAPSNQDELLLLHTEPNVFDLDEVDDVLFYTFKGKNEIYFQDLLANYRNKIPRSNTKDDTQIRMKDSNATDIKYIRAYNRLQQRTKVPNPCAKAPSSCSLCLLRPATPFKGLDYTCKCYYDPSKDDLYACEDDSVTKVQSVDSSKKTSHIEHILSGAVEVNRPTSLGIRIFLVVCVIIGTITVGVGVYFAIRKRNLLRFTNDGNDGVLLNPNDDT